MTSGYWKKYYDRDLLEFSESVREEYEISSTGVQIHLDVYPHPQRNAPVIVFNHGAAGYCRLFVPLAKAFRERGYTVVLPDQRGQGLSAGGRGDYSIAECVQNILDASRWAKNRFRSPLFLAGGSVGGGLTYYAVAAGAPANAVACLNLVDFGNGADGLGFSRLAVFARIPGFAAVLKAAALRLAAFGRLRIPFRWMGAFEKLMDERDSDFQRKWDADPVPPRLVSLRSLTSNLCTPPAVPFAENRMPILVVNQRLDRMVDPSVTRRNYEKLGGPKKYLEVAFGHWSSQPEFWNTFVQACEEWFRDHLQMDAGKDRTTGG